MLSDYPMLPTIPVHDLSRARRWYAEKLGLTPVSEVPDALVYQTRHGGFLLFSSREAGAVKHQIAAWRVPDIDATVSALRGRGVRFEEYSEPGLQTAHGIATTPAGRTAWFHDSEGNTLTISQPE
jgi:catechol 2,3-dioxygenase-like lactoylglutathione lyase family enzyme